MKKQFCPVNRSRAFRQLILLRILILAQDGVYPEAGVDIGSDSGSDLDDAEDEELDDISDDSADQDTQMDEDPPLKVYQQNIPYDYRLI